MARGDPGTSGDRRVTYAWHHLAVLAGCLALVRPLAAARWTWREPRTALLVWQAVAFAGVLSLVGTVLAAGLAPYRRGVLVSVLLFGRDLVTDHLPAGLGPVRLGVTAAGLATVAWLAASTTGCALRAARTRRRHRTLLGVLASPDRLHGALVIDHPTAAAYCLPGRPADVVVSTGTLGLLTADQLAAVLEHERAHARERHHLLLLPFSALSRAVPRSTVVRHVADAVALLVEMRADDHAARRHGTGTLAAALGRFGAAVADGPLGALGAAGGDVGLRIARLTGAPERLPRTAQALALAGGLLLAGTPLSLFVLPA